MQEIEIQIQDILNKYANTATEKYLLEAKLRLLVSLVEKKQMEEDHKIVLEMFEKTLEMLGY
jgi:hypothetical protein